MPTESETTAQRFRVSTHHDGYYCASIPRYEGGDVVNAADYDALLSEVAQLRAEALKGICVYCGYIERYESLEQKAGEAGNAMRVAHIRQCEARPELKLIALSEQAMAEVAQLREALQKILDNDDECGCEHDNANCCELNHVFCPRCIAARALRGKEKASGDGK